MEYFLGIDFGTSGARAIAIDHQAQIVSQVKVDFGQSPANLGLQWQQALFKLLFDIPREIRKDLKKIAINGTSSTVLLSDRQGRILREPILYNDARGQSFLEDIASFAPADHVVNSATSSLAKLFWLREQPYFSDASYFLHQADWLGFLLHGKLGISDYHNALKLGYDVTNLCYPVWLKEQDFRNLLPTLIAPGEAIGNVTQEACDRFLISPNCLVCGGTTDSIAAFIASGACQPGEAVTSLGSTLVLKLLSTQKIESREYGIYSHRLGKLWLTGGASNTGGAVLKQFFTPEELASLPAQIDPTKTSKFDYYPLLSPGERFPFNDPNLLPRLKPRPQSKVEFLYELLAAIARIEAQGYTKLQELGANNLTKVITAGGGSVNQTWQKIRQQHLGVTTSKAKYTEAAYGSALLALNGSYE